MLIRLIAIFFLIFLNGFFVASEMALISVRKTRIEELVQKKVKTAILVKRALEDLNVFISTTQLGSTLVSITLGWVAEPLFNNSNIVSRGFLLATVLVIMITLFHLVFGELAPKAAALQEPEKHSLFLIIPLFFFTKIFSPISYVLNYLVALILKLAGFKSKRPINKPYSEQEIRVILGYGQKDGIITTSKEKLENIFNR